LGTKGYLKQLGNETFVYGISGAIRRSINVFLLPLYTRVFSPADYGIIGSLTSFADCMSLLIILGLDSASGRWFYDTPETAQRMQVISSWFWCQLTAGMAAAILLGFFAPQIAGLLLKSEGSAGLVYLIAGTIPLGTFLKVVGNWFRYQRRAWMVMIYSTISSLGTIGLIILFVLVWQKGLPGFFSARWIASFSMAVAAAAILKTWISPRYVSWMVLKKMLSYGLPLIPAAFASWVTASSDRLLLPLFQGTKETGLYTVAGSVASGMALVTTAFQMAWAPFAFSIYRDPDAPQVFGKVFSLYALLGCFLGTEITFFTPFLLRLFTTPEYYPAASCVSFLVFSHLALGAMYIVSTGAAIVKKSTTVAMSIFIGAGMNTGLNFLLIPSFGKEGAALSTLIANLVMVIYLYWASQKLYPLPYRVKEALLCFGFSGLLIGANHWMIPPGGVTTFLLRIGMGLLFLPFGLFLKIVKFEDLRLLGFQLILLFRPRRNP
jgi:O-antigen/teichoic acid export membrane protein